MKRFSERQRIEIALIWTLSLFLLYMLVLAPFLTAQREAAHGDRAAAQATLARVEAYQRVLRADEKTEEKLRARQVRLTSALPREGGQGTFIHEVERIAHRSGVTVEGFAPQSLARAEYIAVQPMELKIRGTYFSVLSFLHAIQEEGRAIRFGDAILTVEGHELHLTVCMETAVYGGTE